MNNNLLNTSQGRLADLRNLHRYSLLKKNIICIFDNACLITQYTNIPTNTCSKNVESSWRHASWPFHSLIHSLSSKSQLLLLTIEFSLSFSFYLLNLLFRFFAVICFPFSHFYMACHCNSASPGCFHSYNFCLL